MHGITHRPALSFFSRRSSFELHVRSRSLREEGASEKSTHQSRMKTPKVCRPSRRTVASVSKRASRIWRMMGGSVALRVACGQRSIATRRNPDPLRRRDAEQARGEEGRFAQGGVEAVVRKKRFTAVFPLNVQPSKPQRYNRVYMLA